MQSANISSGVRKAIYCQYLPSFSTHADQVFYCPIHDTCTVEYYTYSPGIDAINTFFAIQLGSTKLLESANIFHCCLAFHLGNERPVQLKKSRCLAVALFLNFPGALVIWWLYSTAIHIPYSFCFFSFSWQHTCLTQRTSLFPLRKSLPLEQVRLGLWALCPSSVCIKLSSFVTLGSVSTWLV